MTGLISAATVNVGGNWINPVPAGDHSPVNIRSTSCLTVGTKPFE